jgi:hypothetical protein
VGKRIAKNMGSRCKDAREKEKVGVLIVFEIDRGS